MRRTNLSSLVILVVDDQAENRDLLNIFLSSLGHSVLEACDGLEAVKVATRYRPDLIIMDLSMPVMDGFTAVKILREVEQTRTLPILACTAHETTTHRAQALSVGFTEFLPKPIDFDKLDFLLAEFLKAA